MGTGQRRTSVAADLADEFSSDSELDANQETLLAKELPALAPPPATDDIPTLGPCSVPASSSVAPQQLPTLPDGPPVTLALLPLIFSQNSNEYIEHVIAAKTRIAELAVVTEHSELLLTASRRKLSRRKLLCLELRQKISLVDTGASSATNEGVRSQVLLERALIVLQRLNGAHKKISQLYSARQKEANNKIAVAIADAAAKTQEALIALRAQTRTLEESLSYETLRNQRLHDSLAGAMRRLACRDAWICDIRLHIEMFGSPYQPSNSCDMTSICLSDYRQACILDLHSADLTLCAALPKLCNLVIAEISNNNFLSIDFLRGLQPLCIVNVSKNKIAHLDFLEDARNTVMWLNAGYNPMSTLCEISFPHLVYLNISSCGLRELPLLNMAILFKLDVSKNDLTTLHFNTWLPLLQHVDAAENKITHISPMENCPYLKFLVLRGNPISDLYQLMAFATCPNLSTVNLIDTPLCKIPKLAELASGVPGLFSLAQIIAEIPERPLMNVLSHALLKLYPAKTMGVGFWSMKTEQATFDELAVQMHQSKAAEEALAQIEDVRRMLAEGKLKEQLVYRASEIFKNTRQRLDAIVADGSQQTMEYTRTKMMCDMRGTLACVLQPLCRGSLARKHRDELRKHRNERIKAANICQGAVVLWLGRMQRKNALRQRTEAHEAASVALQSAAKRMAEFAAAQTALMVSPGDAASRSNDPDFALATGLKSSGGATLSLLLGYGEPHILDEEEGLPGLLPPELESTETVDGDHELEEDIEAILVSPPADLDQLFGENSLRKLADTVALQSLAPPRPAEQTNRKSQPLTTPCKPTNVPPHPRLEKRPVVRRLYGGSSVQKQVALASKGHRDTAVSGGAADSNEEIDHISIASEDDSVALPQDEIGETPTLSGDRTRYCWTRVLPTLARQTGPIVFPPIFPASGQTPKANATLLRRETAIIRHLIDHGAPMHAPAHIGKCVAAFLGAEDKRKSKK